LDGHVGEIHTGSVSVLDGALATAAVASSRTTVISTVDCTTSGSVQNLGNSHGSNTGLSFGDSEVAGLAPASAPAVLYDPALRSFSVALIGKSNDSHGVVRGCGAGRVDHSSLVALKSSGIESDGNDTVSEHSFEVLFGSSGNALSHVGLFPSGVAVSVFGDVRVVGLHSLTVSLGEVDGAGGPAATGAAHFRSETVLKVLFGQVWG